MANNYITLTADDGITSLRYKAIQMQPILAPNKSVYTVVDGGYDIVYGQNHAIMRYVIRAPYQATPPFGTYAQLIAFIRRNNPSVVPSPVFTLVDHYGSSHVGCIFAPEETQIDLLTTMLDTSTSASSYMVPVSILLAPGDGFI